jgi:NCAIR mutase (PurE)-related protein
MIAEEINPDFTRRIRTGLDEAIYAPGKSAAQIAALLDIAASRGDRVLLTRLDPDKLLGLPPRQLSRVDYCPLSRTALFGGSPACAAPRIAIVAAGWSDVPVAREAERTLRHHGQGATMIIDIGVAGLSRLLMRLEEIRRHVVVIVVAGMEGALPSVVGGLVAVPVIAVPTSVGYGIAHGGRVALEAMLASCAPGITVVNIDNGYGAACAAIRVLHDTRSRPTLSAPAPRIEQLERIHEQT